MQQPDEGPSGPRRWFRRIAVAATALIVALAAAELTTRWLVFGHAKIGWRHRKPERYADPFAEDDYWKLARMLRDDGLVPRAPHPTLGWCGDFDALTFRHRLSAEVGERRPVLLYGDSFSACVGEVECFEAFLNADPAFAAENYLLNYGVGGYGLGQIWQLLERSLGGYVATDAPPPFVIVGLMILDLDRSILSYRVGQKPRFALVDGELVQVGPPIDPEPERWLREHPPEIPSYAWRYLVHHPAIPVQLSSWLRGETERRAEKRALNAAILERICAALEARGLEFTFLVFQSRPPTPGDEAGSDWRMAFLREWFESRGVPYLCSLEITARRAPDASLADLFQAGDGHPTTLQNSLIATELRELILAGEKPMK